MLLFQRKIKLIDSGFFDGFVDCHNHILPGVDDGVKTAEESLRALDYFAQLGIRKAIFTPHVMKGLSNNKESLNHSFDVFRQQHHGKVEIALGAEYMLDSDFEHHFETGLHYLEGDQVLVETSYLSASKNLHEQLYRLAIAGSTPVIAHPERYLYMGRLDYHNIKKNDYLFQLNLLSLSGCYGKAVMKNAEYLLEQGMYDMAGTDLHNLNRFRQWIDPLKLSQKQISRLMKLSITK